MYKDLLATTPLFVLPLVALAIFIGVWVATTLRAMTRPRSEIDLAARLPLAADDNEEARHD
jgi:hypothetical protein